MNNQGHFLIHMSTAERYEWTCLNTPSSITGSGDLETVDDSWIVCKNSEAKGITQNGLTSSEKLHCFFYQCLLFWVLTERGAKHGLSVGF